MKNMAWSVLGWIVTASVASAAVEDCNLTTTVSLDSGGTVQMRFCSIPAKLGVLIGNATGPADERPVVARDFESFAMAQFEVTQIQYETLLGERPWEKVNGQVGPNHPAVGMLFRDALRFAEKVDALDSTATYRLPTEAEWEYAARGGEFPEANYYWGDAFDPQYAFYRMNSANRAQDVTTCPNQGLKVGYCANDFGLMHMLGNVWEWNLDRYKRGHDNSHRDGHRAEVSPPQGSTTVVKGSAYNDSPRNLRSANRFGFWDGTRPNVGFRLVRVSHTRGTQ